MILEQIPAGARIFDCRHRLGDPEWGRRGFAAGHIPGARHLHLDEELSAPVSPDRIGGRHPLPDPEAFAALLRGHGVSTGQLVVAYDDIGGAFAARLWWMLRWLGHDSAAVLSGGLDAWSGSLELGPAGPVVPGDFQARPRPERVASRQEAAEAALLIDCRDGPRYRGEVEPIDPVPGHIPGAISRPWRDGLVGGRLTRQPQIPPGPGVAYCGSGVTACAVLLMLSDAGRDDVRLYPGSWSDWLAAGGPVATGG